VPRPLGGARTRRLSTGPRGSLERVTTIALGTEIDGIVESEDLAASHEDSPTAVALLD
jgi:glyoxylate carboligase